MKSKLQLLVLTTALIVLSAAIGMANDLSLKATGLTIIPGSGAYDTLRFTITWNNSWYNTTAPTTSSPTPPANYDAVWVFAKYQDCSANAWYPVHLSGSSTANASTVTGGLQADTVSDSLGVFIHLSSAGSGTVSGVASLLFNASNLTGTSPFNFKVFGIEMVQIPTDSFQLGDGTSANTFSSVNIGSESSIANANTALGNSYSGAMNASFPKGYHQIYCMKYEVTAQQYVDFLNTLTYTQQTTFTVQPPNTAANNWAIYGTDRNPIQIQISGYSPTQTPAVYACNLNSGANGAYENSGSYNSAYSGADLPENYMQWSDLLGYLNWAGLRPMTEMEYEKICRGGPPSIIQRIPNEYVWGGTTINPVESANGNTSYCASGTYSDTNEVPVATGSYSVSLTSGNCVINNSDPGNGNTVEAYVNGPMRVGCLATSTSTMQTAGATYWGVLDMSGNVWEQTVTTYTMAGCAFLGTRGNGSVTTGPPSDWPAASSSIQRGSAWNTSTTYAKISDRSYLGGAGLGRVSGAGGRGVRQY